MTVDTSYRRTLGIAMFAAIGTFLTGFDTGIATSTIGHKSWAAYFNKPSHSMTGAVVSLYIAGNAIGSIMQSLLGDKMGRLHFMKLMCFVVTVGTTIQTASINLGMFLAGRAIAGVAIGGFIGSVPMYLSEISSPTSRGLIGGMAGCGITLGNFTANWIGFACIYAPYGQAQWRIPLGLQIPWGIILAAGLLTFLPQSPRELIRQGKVEASQKVFRKLRSDLNEDAVHAEFDLMCRQIEFETQRQMPLKQALRLYRRRILVSIAAVSITSLCGFNVIAYYQTILYRALGVESHMNLALAGIYGTVAFTVSVITTVFLTDQWGRRKMMLLGMSGILIVLIYLAVMQREFGNTGNEVGKGFAVAGIYIFDLFYAGMLNSTTWLYAAEVLPINIRSRVVGIGCMVHFVLNIALTQAGPDAFATIHENYYYVFVGCLSIFLVLGYIYFPETKQRTLEEIAAAFGDEVVEHETEPSANSEKGRAEAHISAFHME